ncbi:Peptidase G1 [Tylopilus felleus]
MLFNFGLISSFLLAAAVLAHPPRDREHHLSQLSTRDIISKSWGGAEFLGPRAGSFSSITSTFYVPFIYDQLKSPFAIFVGLDGISCPAFLRAGIDVKPRDGRPYYQAWYEWYPKIRKEYFDIKVSAGDKVRISVSSATPGLGVVIVENLSKNTQVGEELSAAEVICGQDAQLAVAPHDIKVPLSNFDHFVFMDIEADSVQDPNERDWATLVDLQQGDKMMVQVSNLDGTILVEHFV